MVKENKLNYWSLIFFNHPKFNSSWIYVLNFSRNYGHKPTSFCHMLSSHHLVFVNFPSINISGIYVVPSSITICYVSSWLPLPFIASYACLMWLPSMTIYAIFTAILPTLVTSRMLRKICHLSEKPHYLSYTQPTSCRVN